MAEQPNFYEIVLTQGDLEINLASDDVFFISRQMDKWFQILMDDRYVPIAMGSKPDSKPQQAPAPEAPVAPVPSPQPEVAPVPVPVATPVVLAPAVTPSVAPVDVTASEPATVEAQASAVEDALSSEPPSPQPAVPAAENIPEAIKDDFEAVMDTLMKDLEQAEPSAVVYAAATDETPVIDKVDLNEIDSLAELCERSKATTSEDYLILTAYYLTYFEGIDKFSLKRINSLLVKSGLTPVNHSVLESSMTKNYLVMVPDLTGMADVSEYTLSDAGQHYANKLL